MYEIEWQQHIEQNKRFFHQMGIVCLAAQIKVVEKEEKVVEEQL